MAIKPFIDRFVVEDKRARAVTLFVPKQPRAEWNELIRMIDTHRGRTFKADELDEWHATRGVFLVDRDAFSVSTKDALGLYVTGESLFIAYGGMFAVVHEKVGASLLLT